MSAAPTARQSPIAPAASAAQIALLVAAIIAIIVCVALLLRRGREKFVSQRAREIHARAQEVFRAGDARYSDYKKKVPGADPVQYTDLRRLHRAGELTPATVQAVM